MKVRVLLLVVVTMSMALGPLGGIVGGPSVAAYPQMRAAQRADPGITALGIHSSEADWDFTDSSLYTKSLVEVAPGKVNLSQALNSSGELWTRLLALGGGNEREDFSAAYDDINNQMIIHGGYYYTSGMQNANYYQNLYTYDPAANSWTDRGAAKLPHGNVGVWDNADKCFITHGGALFDMYGDVYYAETWAWYPATATWSQLADGPTRFFHSAAWDPVDGVMLVFGGQDTDQGSPYNDLWAYSYMSNTWTMLRPQGGGPSARIDHTAVWDTENGQMIVFGGFASGNPLSDVWTYNYTQNSWTRKASAASGRASHAACWNGDLNVMTVSGGRVGISNSNDTLTYDPSADSWRASSAMPAAGRIESSAVYDPVRKQMIVYGGGTGNGMDEFTDTWSFSYGEPVLRYAASGSIQSRIMDMGENFHSLDRVSWYGDMPADTNITLRVHSSNGNINLSGYQELANGTRPFQQGRYTQWNITLKASPDNMTSPLVGLVKVEYTLNCKPNVTVTPSVQAFKRAKSTLNSSVVDADGDPLTYNWTKASGPDAVLNSTAVPNPSFTPEKSGSYVFALVVYDGYANSTPVTTTVTVVNRPPTGDAGPDQTGVKNELLTFHSNATDPDKDPLKYEWTQIGGANINLTQTDKPYLTILPAKLGNFTFQLVVSDGESESAPTNVTARILAQPPAAVLTSSALLIYLNGSVEFSAERSSDPDGSVARYFYDFGDGKDSGWTEDANINHTYSKPGIFNATLKVRDDDGIVSNNSAPVKITVRNRPPVVRGQVVPEEGNTSTIFRFSVPSGSTYDPDGVIVAYDWDFGDGAHATASATSHVYKKRGDYEIRFRVTDDVGDIAEVYFNISVFNRGPVIQSSTPGAVSVMVLGNEQLFTTTASDPDSDPVTYLWKVDGIAQSANGSSFIFKPAAKGDHKVNLTISDGELSTDMEWTVTVKGRPVVTEGGSIEGYVLPAMIIIIVAAGIGGMFLYSRMKSKEDDQPPIQPSAQYLRPMTDASAPPDMQQQSSYPSQSSYPQQYSYPEQSSYQQQPSSEPQEAIPYAEPIDQSQGASADAAGPVEALPVAEEVPQAQPYPPATQTYPPPEENWKPVQEPYSKQLWNK